MELLEEAEFEEVLLKPETAPLGVCADELHEEIQLISRLQAETADGAVDALLVADAFPPSQLAAATKIALGGRPVLGLYHGGENSTMVRICITDVAFLHSLRDQILNGEFEIRVTQLVSSIERGSGETVRQATD